MVSGYYSDREGKVSPRVEERINPQTWAGILSLIQGRIADGSFGYGFPAECQDGGAIYGTDESSLWDRAIAEIPRLLSASDESDRPPWWRPRLDADPVVWRPRRDLVPPTDAILDLCELLARNVGDPQVLRHHGFFQHDHLRYDPEAGLAAWVDDLNRLFARAGLAYDMEANGSIRRLLSTVLQGVIVPSEFATGDPDTDALLERAVALLTSRATDAHQDALEKLWDAFERIKTLHPGDKKQSAEALLLAAESPKSPLFNESIATEFATLTALGNKLRIRHSETDKEPIRSRRDAECLFHRMFALLRHVLLQTDRMRKA